MQTPLKKKGPLSPLARCGPVGEGTSGRVLNWTVRLLNRLHHHHSGNCVACQAKRYIRITVWRLSISLSFYPSATRCGGDIVTLPWFYQCVRQCIRASRLILVNAIATKLLCTSSSNLEDVHYDERMNPIDFRGQGSRSQLTYMEISL